MKKFLRCSSGSPTSRTLTTRLRVRARRRYLTSRSRRSRRSGKRILICRTASLARGVTMALFFHSDDVDQLIPFKEAVQITENALRDMISSDGVCAPRKRLNLHRNIAEGSFDTVLNIYAGGGGSYGTIGAQEGLHGKGDAGRTQKPP